MPTTLYSVCSRLSESPPKDQTHLATPSLQFSSCIVYTRTDELIKIKKKKRKNKVPAERERERERERTNEIVRRVFQEICSAINSREMKHCADLTRKSAAFQVLFHELKNDVKRISNLLPYCRRVNDVMLYMMR